MRKLLRDTIRTIERAGGANVHVVELSRHSRIDFTIQGKPEYVIIHVGEIVTRRQAPALRAELRRKGLKV